MPIVRNCYILLPLTNLRSIVIAFVELAERFSVRHGSCIEGLKLTPDSSMVLQSSSCVILRTTYIQGQILIISLFRPTSSREAFLQVQLPVLVVREIKQVLSVKDNVPPLASVFSISFGRQ